jgi:hypothetical protein
MFTNETNNNTIRKAINDNNEGDIQPLMGEKEQRKILISILCGSIAFFCFLLLLTKICCPKPDMKQEEEERERLNIEMKAMKMRFEMIEEEKNASDTDSNDDGVDAGDNDVPATNNKYNRISKDYRQLLITFFEENDPPRIATVDALLEKNKGSEQEFFDNLLKKYNA